jgi:hypothetical protein
MVKRQLLCVDYLHVMRWLTMSSTASLFIIVPNDDLQLWKGNMVDFQKVRQFVNLDIRDIARMTGVPKASIRFDQRAPDEVKEQLEGIATICNLVYQFFKDEVKTKLWIQTPNSMLGNSAPRDMIRVGRYKKLLNFVTDALEVVIADETVNSASKQNEECLR